MRKIYVNNGIIQLDEDECTINIYQGEQFLWGGNAENVTLPFHNGKDTIHIFGKGMSSSFLAITNSQQDYNLIYSFLISNGATDKVKPNMRRIGENSHSGFTGQTSYSQQKLDGIGYEKACAEYLERNGYLNVKITPASGDQGVDIIAEKNGMKYGIQCKFYSQPVGNKAVQEIYSGILYYSCDKAVVMTNNDFTKSARELAAATGVELWGNMTLDRILLDNTPKTEDSNIQDSEIENNFQESSLNGKKINWHIHGVWYISEGDGSILIKNRQKTIYEGKIDEIQIRNYSSSTLELAFPNSDEIHFCTGTNTNIDYLYQYLIQNGNISFIYKKNNVKKTESHNPTQTNDLLFWILGWIFCFPIPLTILLLRKAKDNKAAKVVIPIMWIVVCSFIFLGGSNNKETETNNKQVSDEELSTEKNSLSNTKDKSKNKKKSKKQNKAAGFTDGKLNEKGEIFTSSGSMDCSMTSVDFRKSKIKQDTFGYDIFIKYKITNKTNGDVEYIFDVNNQSKNYLQKGELTWILVNSFEKDKDFPNETVTSATIKPNDTYTGTMRLTYSTNFGDGDDFYLKKGDEVTIHLLYYENGNEWDLSSTYKL